MAGEVEQIYMLIGTCVFIGLMFGGVIGALTNIYVRAWMMNRMGMKGGRNAVGRIHTPSGLVKEYVFNESEEMVWLAGKLYWPKKIGYVERKFNVPIYEFFEGETGGSQFELETIEFKDSNSTSQSASKLSLKTSTDKPISSSAIAASYETFKAKEAARMVNKNTKIVTVLLIIVAALAGLGVLLSYLSMTAAGEGKGVCQAVITSLLAAKGG